MRVLQNSKVRNVCSRSLIYIPLVNNGDVVSVLRRFTDIVGFSLQLRRKFGGKLSRWAQPQHWAKLLLR